MLNGNGERELDEVGDADLSQEVVSASDVADWTVWGGNNNDATSSSLSTTSTSPSKAMTQDGMSYTDATLCQMTRQRRADQEHYMDDEDTRKIT